MATKRIAQPARPKSKLLSSNTRRRTTSMLVGISTPKTRRPPTSTVKGGKGRTPRYGPLRAFKTLSRGQRREYDTGGNGSLSTR
jgi:hypothetical protein